MKLLLNVNKKKGVTLVFVSHDMDIASYGKRTIVLKDGRIVGDTKGKLNNFKKAFKKFPKKTRGERPGSE
jgi:ABC-type lipoprotein export system ATPase subunit